MLLVVTAVEADTPKRLTHALRDDWKDQEKQHHERCKRMALDLGLLNPEREPLCHGLNRLARAGDGAPANAVRPLLLDLRGDMQTNFKAHGRCEKGQRNERLQQKRIEVIEPAVVNTGKGQESRVRW